jgi:ABC-type multidrug transport system fused ATPase/permease subunit
MSKNKTKADLLKDLKNIKLNNVSLQEQIDEITTERNFMATKLSEAIKYTGDNAVLKSQLKEESIFDKIRWWLEDNIKNKVLMLGATMLATLLVSIALHFIIVGVFNLGSFAAAISYILVALAGILFVFNVFTDPKEGQKTVGILRFINFRNIGIGMLVLIFLNMLRCGSGNSTEELIKPIIEVTPVEVIDSMNVEISEGKEAIIKLDELANSTDSAYLEAKKGLEIFLKTK